MLSTTSARVAPMPINRSIDHETRIVTTQCWGAMTHSDIQVEQRTFWMQDWLNGYGEIFDMRKADFTDILGTRSRYAAVVASSDQTDLVPVAMVFDQQNPSQKELASRYIEDRRALSEVSTCEGFEDFQQAEQWLKQRL